MSRSSTRQANSVGPASDQPDTGFGVSEFPSNGPVSQTAGLIVRIFEKLRLRGAPTLLVLLSKVPHLRRSLAVVRVGHRRIVFPAFDPYWSRYLWASAPYERDVEEIFRKIGRGRILVDCGANIGYWSVRASDFGIKQVVAIEANRELVPLLRENFRLNGIHGTVHHAAVYSISGQDLFLDHTAAHAQGGIGECGMPVRSITIMDAVKDVAPGQELVVKLDVEGAEIPAFEGAHGLEDAIFVYEDFVRYDMVVTRYLLGRRMAIFGVAPPGIQRRITTPEEALAFSLEFATRGGPSNLVACSTQKAPEVERELSR